MSIQKLIENLTFEAYRKAANRLCKKCPYTKCQFRNKRESLKRQRIDYRKIRCQKESDELLKKAFNKKFP